MRVTIGRRHGGLVSRLLACGVCLWGALPAGAQSPSALPGPAPAAATPSGVARKSLDVEAPDENQGVQGFFFVIGSKNVFNVGGPNTGPRSGPRWSGALNAQADPAVPVSPAAAAPGGSETSLEIFDENQGVQGLFVVIGSANVFNLGGPNTGPGSGPRWVGKAVATEKTAEAEVHEAIGRLNEAFAKRDRVAIKRLLGEDHIAVTPYYGRPQNRRQQLATLKDLNLTKYAAGELTVRLLAPETALVTYPLSLAGTYKGKAVPAANSASAVWQKNAGRWQETYYQETAVRP